jgi:tyrosinase
MEDVMTRSPVAALTRRGFLGASAAALGASALPSGALAQNARFRRWEISDPSMPARVLDSYKKAISAMLRLPPTDPRNWYRSAFVHLFDCPHGNWWFLPWHRGFLGWFERACRELSGDADFALPYWDWTKTPSVPAAMFQDVLDPNNTAFIATFNALKQQFDAAVTGLYPTFSTAQKATLARRGLSTTADFWANVAAAQDNGMFYEQPDARGVTAANPDLDPTTKAAVAAGIITSSLRVPTFSEDSSGNAAGFGSDKVANHSDEGRKGILESLPHDNVHGALGGSTGGFMWAFLSPVDPIFFLHHGNLDRLWEVWTRRQRALGRPTLPEGLDLATWSDEQFLFFSDERGQPVAKTKAGEYATTSFFDYDYSPGSGEDQIPPPVVAAIPARPATQRFSALITSQTVGADQPAGGVAEVPAAALQAPLPQAAPAVAEVTLNLPHGTVGRRFRVLVSPPGGGTPREVGGITPFGMHGGRKTFTVPLPADLGAPATAGNVALDIRVVPVEPTVTPDTTTRPGGPRTSPARPAAPAPQVVAIQVRTS